MFITCVRAYRSCLRIHQLRQPYAKCAGVTEYLGTFFSGAKKGRRCPNRFQIPPPFRRITRGFVCRLSVNLAENALSFLRVQKSARRRERQAEMLSSPQHPPVQRRADFLSGFANARSLFRSERSAVSSSTPAPTLRQQTDVTGDLEIPCIPGAKRTH